MIHVKKFIERVSLVEAKRSKDVVLPIEDARGLRDELTKLIADLYELAGVKEKERNSEAIQVEVKGGSFK